jgi:glycosyltransferase involved in cell wall biosynthesis
MPDRSRRLRRSNVRALHLPVVELTQSFVYVARLARRLKVLGPDVVHTNTLKSALYGGAASRIACIPCIWHIRDRIATDYLPPTAVRLVRLAAKSIPSAIIANSQTTLDTLRLKPNHRNRTVHDSVVAARDPHADTSSVIPSPVVMPPDEVSSGNAASQFNVGMIGRIAPWKGQDVFLRAFAKAFSETEARATLVGSAMFGEDGYETELRDLVQNLGIADRVEFRGFREDVFAELQRVDVLVHASVLPEPFGQVVVEGMAAGLPVVAARAGGPAEILIEGETGLLYSPGDVDELAMILRRLANDRQLRQELGMRGRAAAQMFSPERVAHQILDVYRHTVRPAQC